MASEVDEATIIGEPLPVGKGGRDEVFAGTLNGTGALTVRLAGAHLGAGGAGVAELFIE